MANSYKNLNLAYVLDKGGPIKLYILKINFENGAFIKPSAFMIFIIWGMMLF